MMKPNHAIVLKNWFPKTSYCELRGGYAASATGMTGAGKTLAVYNGQNGTNKMFCATASGVYDVSSAGAVGASVAARTDGKHQTLMFGDGTNHYLMMFNGVDKPLFYNGTAWVAVDNVSVPALTGLTTTSIISAFEMKGRLYFIEKSSLSFWYLPAGAAGGALLEFPLEGVAKKGGYLMAGATWTYDGGSGPDDRAVFITSEGEVIVYAGDNPSSSVFWELVGVFELGKPLGRKCLSKYGGDLIAITQNGVFPLSSSLQSAMVDNRPAITNIIENSFTETARSYGSVFGWEAIIYPAQSALIVNIPFAENGVHEQYVMNTITKAWCKFTDWNAETFAVFNGELYFANGTSTYKAWTGAADNGSNITCYGKTAFSYFNDVGSQKRVNMFRPVLATNGSIGFLTDIDVDFRDTEITGQATYTVTNGAKWNVGNWNEVYWASGMEIVKDWTSPDEYLGYCVSGKIKIATNALTIQWIANDFMYEVAGPL
jgi:predicted heme/steroid binding protein